MATSQAQQTVYVPQNLNIPPVRTWPIVIPNDRQDDPESHRQSRYHPHAHSVIHPNDQEFEDHLHDVDPFTGNLDPRFMWARLLLDTRATVFGRLRRLVDERNPLDFEYVDPSRSGDELDPGLGPGQTHRGLRDAFEMLFAKNLLATREAPRNVIRQDQIKDVVYNGQRWDFFRKLMAREPAFLKNEELNRILWGIGGVRPEFDWIHYYLASTNDAVEGMIAAVTWASQSDAQGQPRSLDAALAAAEKNIPEMTRLISFLLEKEEAFFDHFTDEHIFGCLNDKRINLLASRQLSRLWQMFFTPSVMDLDNPDDDGNIPFVEGVTLFDTQPKRDLPYSYIYGRLPNLYQRMKQYQQELRDTFDYRSLVEWGYDTLWNRLYVTISPELGISDATVNEFLAWTTNTYLTSKIFPVHPVPRGKFVDHKCMVCFERLEDPAPGPDTSTPDPEAAPIFGRLIMELKCNHAFHPECVIGVWDGYNKWTNQCPMCRTPAGSLRDMITGFPAGTTDRDYQLVAGASGIDDQWSLTMANCFDNEADPMEYDREVHDAYWRPLIYEFLTELRKDREAARAFNYGKRYGL